MIKNNLIKTISLTIVAMSVTLSNTIYANAEDSVNIEQMKSELAKGGNYTSQDFNAVADDFKFEGETTVKNGLDAQITNLGFKDEKLYYFSFSKYVRISAYYGLASKYIYIKCQGNGGGTIDVLKDGYIYAKFEFYSARYGGNGWTGIDGWSEETQNTWRYFKDGIVQTGWIYDNGKWYYCSSNGEMAHDTTIDGYQLGADGAWIQ
ncbi:MAG: hypothetical protein ABF652_17625 [Clostridium beijerinckii]